ncbi:ABC transporter-related protein [Pyrolobus fumarii 1A]|uniref:ABC transporter-related protein n=1 Tax=Pyrolobus fumarii (strain DSM 11204 / 1A) TaxID=694429 RepID=G0ED72_PYRF1|nr:ABC transporter ATP-binding protein [Pyrolobus fumarii]AEM39750.1 ABC transporter-related protein [Pyrolobus fumarii 1A]
MPLVVRNLHKRYGRVTAVQGVSFELREGSVLGLVGPNGAGKTTTIKSILGFVRPQAGEILVDGLPAWSREARRKLGYVPELPEAPLWLTPRRLLELLAEMEGLPRTEARREAERALEELGLVDHADKRLGALSKGLRKRVLIAQSLLNIEAKRYILMDEPMSGLDPEWVSRLRGLIRRLREQGVGILVSSHLLRELEGLADEVVIISRGRVVYKGGLEELAARMKVGGVVEARVSDARRVAEVLRSSGLVERVEVEGDVVRAWVARDADTSSVVKLIYDAGVNVLSVEAKRVSLEDAYRRLVSEAR